MLKKKNEIFMAIKEDILNNAKSYFIVITIFICLTNSLFYKDKVKNIINFLKNRRKSVICEK